MNIGPRPLDRSRKHAARSLGLLLSLGGLLAACASTNAPREADSLTISNLKVGDVCFANNRSEVCRETTDIKITGEGHCVYDGRTIPCTWYGFSFDYRLKASSAKLDCVVTSEKDAEFGNPKGVVAKNVREMKYAIPLTGGAHHLSHPEYSGYTPTVRDDSDTTACAYDGKVVLKFSLALHNGVAPAKS